MAEKSTSQEQQAFTENKFRPCKQLNDKHVHDNHFGGRKGWGDIFVTPFAPFARFHHSKPRSFFFCSVKDVSIDSVIPVLYRQINEFLGNFLIH